MIRRAVFLAAFLLVPPISAFATAPSAPGVNLRWDQCYGDGGAWNKTFACNTNSGSEQLMGSFELAQPLNQVQSAQVVIDIRSESAALPAWWSVSSSGGCRNQSLDFQPDAPSSSCTQWLLGQVGGVINYSVGSQGPSHARASGGFAMPNIQPAVNLAPGVEYFVFRLVINHAKTVGTGSCGGCNVPVCIFLSRISLFQRGASSATIHMERGANYLGSQYATWQNGYPIGVHHECDTVEPHCARQYTAFGCALASPTAQRKSTWGQVKALYR